MVPGADIAYVDGLDSAATSPRQPQTPRNRQVAAGNASKHKLLKRMARLEGLEPPAYRFEVCRSIQLSYRRFLNA